MRSLIAIAALLACSGAWSQDTTVRLLCTFNDGSDSIQTYPLTNLDNTITKEEESDAHSLRCQEWAKVDSDSIEWTQVCSTTNRQCAGQLKTSVARVFVWKFAEINRKTGSITEKVTEDIMHCWPAHAPDGIPDKESKKEKIGTCKLASEVENKF